MRSRAAGTRAHGGTASAHGGTGGHGRFGCLPVRFVGSCPDPGADDPTLEEAGV